MESVMLTIKYVLFCSLGAIVLATAAVTLFVVLYEFLKEQVQILRQGPFPQTKHPFPQLTKDWKSR